MNYRHAFHAGNHADVLKHAVLALVLQHLQRKATPFAVLDTHAGRGAYRLHSEAANRSPEWRGGIGRVWDWPEAPAALATLLDHVRAANPEGTLDVYPGSPAIVLGALRPQDRYMACERHPEECTALRHFAGVDRRAQIHERDGYEAMGALLPFPERRGLVLIDPPYEDRTLDLGRTVAALKLALPRFGYATYLWWRPVKSVAEIDRADAELRAGQPTGQTLRTLRADLAIDRATPEGRLVASSMLVINPPFTLGPALEELLPALARRLAQSEVAGWRLDRGD